MSGACLSAARPVAGRSAPATAGGAGTLEQRLESVLDGLRADRAAACPVCGGAMSRTAAGDGECGSCGTTLS